MTEILFYHLEQRPMEKVLPVLVEKSLERGWKAVIEVGSEERIEDIDALLWTYKDESFLPHAIAGNADADARQPVILTNGKANPNGANIRFYVDRAVPDGEGEYERLVYLFNGHDPEAIADARGAWKALRDAHAVTYWQQDENGRWSKKA